VGAPAAPSLSCPVALMSAPPGEWALIELRSIQSSPEAEISNSSLPICWPLMVMRSLPLSGENTAGAFAGIAALAECGDWEGLAKIHRLKPVLPGGALPGRACKTAAARDNDNAAVNTI